MGAKAVNWFLFGAVIESGQMPVHNLPVQVMSHGWSQSRGVRWWGSWLLLLVLLVLVPGLISQADPPRFEPVHHLHLAGEGGPGQRLAPASFIKLHGLEAARRDVAFHAYTGGAWPPGLTPLYGTEAGPVTLRRLPPRGRENFIEPLFFILPLEEEAGAGEVAGRWNCLAASAHGIRSHFAWELAVHGDQVTGRFDPNTDYRFAFFTRGQLADGLLRLSIEYVNDQYELTGRWLEGRMSGTWRRTDDEDHGTWEAERPDLALPPAHGVPVPLYEWVRAVDGARHYSIDPGWQEPGWARQPGPVGRVWQDREETALGVNEVEK
jgi:hypothetical protein